MSVKEEERLVSERDDAGIGGFRPRFRCLRFDGTGRDITWARFVVDRIAEKEEGHVAR